ncbi:MAG: 30S ribosomal protein S9 [Gemmatimonadota bacterium]|nr:MAG: 30S ribosomal protein S9 [Gemmatimonadota bacterium]
MVGKKLEDGRFHAVGRRKTSVARVYLKRGKGEWQINGRSLADYFPRSAYQTVLEKPFQATETVGEYDVTANVRGGGLTGQAGAIQLGIARALLVEDEDRRTTLRREGLLTRDPRRVERKKYGQPKARKRFQFSKR